MDTCPTFESFLFPLLLEARDSEIRVRSSADSIAKKMGLSEIAMAETTKKGNALKYVDRTYWSATYLRQAGLLVSTKRGFVGITAEGKTVLSSGVTSLSRTDLERYDSFLEFKKPRGQSQLSKHTERPSLVEEEKTPDELIVDAIEQVENALVYDILERLHQGPPAFFEQVIVDLLVSMGYGNAENARVTGKSGDNGIDGIVDQDQLGLDRVYVQAKRYEASNKIGADSIRNFAGSLNYHQANKGLFVTTSSFTSSAIDTAEKVQQRIVLVDGEKLARLMIQTGIGCSVKKSFQVMKLDEDYYDY